MSKNELESTDNQIKDLVDQLCETVEKEGKEEDPYHITKLKQFETGAVRDMAPDRGRFDLVPLDIAGKVFEDEIIEYIGYFQNTNRVEFLYTALSFAIPQQGNNKYELFKELALRFEHGANKYGVDNWKHGLPISSYIDSALRHYDKYKLGLTDEPHFIAFVWNIICCIWSVENK